MRGPCKSEAPGDYPVRHPLRPPLRKSLCNFINNDFKWSVAPCHHDIHEGGCGLSPNFRISGFDQIGFEDLGYGKETERTAELGPSTASSAISGGLISRLPTLSLTHFSGILKGFLLGDFFDDVVSQQCAALK
ncbi:hypothetical protein EVAR_23246_1 [Eumeta japonica]|uniref:Uncharacterized protein n=1 Tax=Eumeta variegata TaxID=151549 RepID=A0A4C1VEB1_EUMVA|nr:hypothetical protein EVAR_23246_1 [Eumeta japonica]